MSDHDCATCDDKGVVPHTSRGSDGFDPCPDCTPVPSGDQPRWTVDENGYLACGTEDGPPWDIHDVADGTRRGHEWALEAFDALVAAVRSAAEVPALREQVAQVEAERTEWFATVDRLAEERDQLLDTSNHRGAVISLQRQRDQLTERLAAAEAVIRRLLDSYQVMDAGSEGYWWVDRDLGAQRRADIPVTDAEAEAIARARGAREPQPTDGPDYHADHRAWEERR